MERLCPCGCGRPIRSAARRVAQSYINAAATRELTDHLGSMCLGHTNEADESDLRTSQEKIDGIIEALKRSLHRRSRHTDRTYIDRMGRPLDALGHGLAVQLEAMDPEFFRDWMDRTRARQRAA